MHAHSAHPERHSAVVEVMCCTKCRTSSKKAALQCLHAHTKTKHILVPFHRTC